MNGHFDPANTPVLDLQVMQQLLDLDDGSTSLLAEMLDLYRLDMPDRLKGLEAAIEAQDGVLVAETAHAVKGASSTMGTPRPRILAAFLERTGRSGEASIGEWRQAKAELMAAYDEAISALEGFIASRA